MLRQITLTVALSIASAMLTSSRTAIATERVQPTVERSAHAAGAATSDCPHRHTQETASLAVFADNRRHLLLHATGDHATGTGHLIAYPLDRTSGELGPALWDASRLLPAATARRIITMNSDGAAVAFQWAAFDDGRRAQLRNDPTVVEYVRGASPNEGSQWGDRQVEGANRLGAIGASSPVLVGPPSFAYRDELEAAPYSEFSRTHAQRPPYVFVGAGDGMLHAIDARTGVEAFAVVPGAMFSRIGEPTGSNGAIDAIVDGSPSIGDAFVGGRWRTILLAGLGRGGHSIVALDITDPTNYTSLEEHPSRVVLWEFTDADLGLSYSQPVIVKLRNGAWAAIFGNGYAAAGSAVLYVVELSSGKIIRKLDAGQVNPSRASSSLPNGLSTPAAVDVNGDRVVEYVYAGDLHGNLWKFDLSSTIATEWKTALDGEPLYQARSASGQPQPIVLRPEVVRGANGAGLFVLFAAGNDQRSTTPAPVSPEHSTLYGVADYDEGMVRRGQLAARSLSSELALKSATSAVRGARTLVIEKEPAAQGWYLDFPAASSAYHAERILTSPSVRDATVTVTTGSTAKDACSTDNVLWTTSLDVLGAEQGRPLFDANLDGYVDSADTLNLEIEGRMEPVFAHGLAIPTLLSAVSGSTASVEAHSADHTCMRFIYVPRTTSEGIVRITRSCRGARGRQSWRQVR